MRRFKSLVGNEEGQSLVLVALFLAILIGFAGLAIDGGRLYLSKSQLQKAADAGALAGAAVMIEGATAGGTFNVEGAKTEAQQMSASNYIDDGGDIVYTIETFPDSTQEGENTVDNIIQVEAKEKLPLFLMPILGIERDSTVSAIAQVRVGAVGTVNKGVVIPIGIELGDLAGIGGGTEMDITEDPGTGDEGWYGLLDFSMECTDPLFYDESTGNGIGEVAYYIENGSPCPIGIGDIIDIQSGNSQNSKNARDAIEAREGDTVYVPIVSRIVVDKDGDLFDDRVDDFVDVDGDNVDDRYSDVDHDGLADRVDDPMVDVDGDGLDDKIDGIVDVDGDGLDDRIDDEVDVDGDGLDDRTVDDVVDMDNDGIDDRIDDKVDVDGDGVDDRNHNNLFIDDTNGQNNDNSHVTVIGFASFILVEYNKEGSNHELTAEFQGVLLPGEMWEEIYSPYNTYVSELIK